MSQSLDRLVYMINQIARNLRLHAHPAAATADHVAHFWDPRMKAMIIDHLAVGGAGLDAIAAAALQRLRDGPAPAPQTAATEYDDTDCGGGSDAG